MKELTIMKYAFALVLAVSGATPAAGQESDKPQIMVTLPVFRSLAEELGDGDFGITALARPDQDPHFVSPTPTLMKRLREAVIFIENGMQLELWADEVANGSGNPKVVRGGAGRIVASTGIPREEIPRVVSRTEGDIHPEGNPHVWLDPLRAKLMAENVAAGLKSAVPERAVAIDARLKAFATRIDEALFGPELVKQVGSRVLLRRAQDGTLFSWLEEKRLSDRLGGWLKRAQPLRGQRVVEFHKTWIYFAKLFGFEIVGSVQPKPGIEPTARHLAGLTETMRGAGVRILIVDDFYDPSYARALAERTDARVAIVPSQPAGGQSYFRFMDGLIDRLVAEGK